ncbi:HIRAN domain-containing protein [Selenomonas sp. FC4001]|uniref:HIRAN domain-containing protein n=1 Tax=Selenomonas sp. FC4001 TaxID=1408313 RepID=UPI00068C40F4|nr:HIRAN domain-containing protein [Selenomonas sp. FC4001]
MDYNGFDGEDDYEDYGDPDEYEEEYERMIDEAIFAEEVYSDYCVNRQNLSQKDTSYSEKETIITTKIAGVTYENRQNAVKKLQIGQDVALVREPNNLYDHNAVAVYCASVQLGYLPAGVASQVAPHMDAGYFISGTVMDVYGGNGYNYGARIKIILKRQKNTSSLDSYDISIWDGLLNYEVDRPNGVDSFYEFVEILNFNGFRGRVTDSNKYGRYVAELEFPETIPFDSYLNIELIEEGKLSSISFTIRKIVQFNGGHYKEESDFFNYLDKAMNDIQIECGFYSSFRKDMLFEDSVSDKYYWINIDASYRFHTFENSLCDIDVTLFDERTPFFSYSIMLDGLKQFISYCVNAQKKISSDNNINWKLKNKGG